MRRATNCGIFSRTLRDETSQRPSSSGAPHAGSSTYGINTFTAPAHGGSWALQTGTTWGGATANATAVIEGVFDRGGEFKRTPKSGGGHAIIERPPRLPVGEVILAVFFIVAFGCFASAKQWMTLPFLTLFLSGFVYVAGAAVRERWRFACTFSG